MSPEVLISELVDRVRDQARSHESEEIRRALAAELRRVARAYARDPAAWSAWADGIDVPGDAYEALVSGADRRAGGQFQTPTWAADLMASWLLQEPCDLLLDPGVGAGRLLFRAAGRPEPAPRRMLGLDVDGVSLEMARVNLLLRGIDNCALRRCNFLLRNLRERPDAVTCNPPYSRHHSIPATEKAAIHAGFEERLGLRLSRLAGLHVLFLVRALEVIREAGRLAFITPAEWLDVNYGWAIKRFVLERAHVEAIVLWEHDHLYFDGALTTAAITLLRAGAGTGPTRVVRLPRRPPAVEEVVAAIEGQRTRLRVADVDLAPGAKWSHPVRRRVPRGKPLRDIARVRRGIATGCNRFFVVSEAARREHGIERSHVRPCITTPRLVPGDELTRADLERLSDDLPRWVLNCHDRDAERRNDALGRYLRWGKDAHDAHAGYLASRRQPWYALERREASPVLFTYMNRQRPRFIRNRAAAVPLNTFLIVEPHDGIDADQLWRALKAEHLMRQLIRAKRNYGGGLWKIEPRELGDLRVRL
ncbi:MAG: HsdM family class I SAM-dependent methyltransferase [Thermoleophilaceae bacterium]